MVNSQKRKREKRKFAQWRKGRNIYKCQDCGKKLRGVLHHAYCNECWKQRKEMGLTTAPKYVFETQRSTTKQFSFVSQNE